MILFIIIYILCIILEIKKVKHNNIDISYKDNFLIVLVISSAFPIALTTFIEFVYFMITSFDDEIFDFSYFYFLSTFIIAAFAYIVYYIKNAIYAFIPNKNKLSYRITGTIYNVEDDVF